MAGLRDAKWLKEQLSRVLGWDELIVEGLVDAVMRAAGAGGDHSELDEMVQNFLVDSPVGVTLIKDFLAQSPSASRGTSSAPATTSSCKSYAASASEPANSPSISNSQPAAPGAAISHRQQQQQQQQKQQQQGRGQRQQQQQQPLKVAANVVSLVAPPGWQALRSSATKSTQATAAIADGKDGGDDFSSFVIDDRAGAAVGRGGPGSRSKPGSSRDLQALEASAAGADKPVSPADVGSGKVLGMFKAGGRIKAPAAKPVGVRGPDGGALALAGSLERKVINCLGCGKIYDCRSVTNDILRFLDRGGICTFCGDTVPLSYKDRQKAAAAATEAAVAAAAAAGAGGVEDEATAAARAFKDRLVEYDRNAAKRTTVIDDQSDFFEIDTNAWLTDQEREELRRRRQLEEEAEAARRKRLTVTIDLIGRKVVVDDDVRKAEEKAAAAAAERTAAAAKAAAAAEALRNTDGDGSGSTCGGGVAFSGSGMAGSVSWPTQEQLAASLESLRRMKATINPAVAATAAPLFLPTSAATGIGGTAGTKAGAGRGGSAHRPGPSAGTAASASSLAPAAAGGGLSRGAGGAATGGRKGVKGAAAAGRSADHHSQSRAARARVHERVQHDLGAEFGFDAFGAEVALDELMGAALLSAGAEEDGPYDICSPELAPSTSSDAAKIPLRLQQQSCPASAALTLTLTPQRPVQGLPPGVVLLKGYLTMDEQIQIVRGVRELGIGPGGFYSPSYNTGARLALQMMCLGLHWEPRTSKYESIRSSFDGAKPPPIPQWLVQLCGRCLAAASASADSPFPPLQPDICLVNFYERSGRLGMHQDKDEMSESLRAGLPVVSLSLGDAADFMYGRTRDVEAASSVRLESGDLLVFGGPGRMIYHSITKIYPNTAPTELIHATGLRPGRLNLTFRQYKAYRRS